MKNCFRCFIQKYAQLSVLSVLKAVNANIMHSVSMYRIIFLMW